VISDDTDVFILLLHYYQKANLAIPITMESPSQGRVAIDIKATVKKHAKIVNCEGASSAISGCYTVGAYHRVGKGTVVKILKAGHKLSAIGDVDSSHEEVMMQATKFISACYSYHNSKSLSEARLLVWTKKNRKGVTSASKLCAIPPTTEAFQENVKRAHYQAIIWQSLDSDDVPDVHPENFGWKKNMSTKSLTPVAIPKSVPLAPDYILNLICCDCSSQNPCSKRCSCKSAGYPKCSVFCACYSVGCSR